MKKLLFCALLWVPIVSGMVKETKKEPFQLTKFPRELIAYILSYGLEHHIFTLQVQHYAPHIPNEKRDILLSRNWAQHPKQHKDYHLMMNQLFIGQKMKCTQKKLDGPNKEGVHLMLSQKTCGCRDCLNSSTLRHWKITLKKSLYIPRSVPCPFSEIENAYISTAALGAHYFAVVARAHSIPNPLLPYRIFFSRYAYGMKDLSGPRYSNFCLHECPAFDRISFITDTTLLGLTEQGDLFVIAHDTQERNIHFYLQKLPFKLCDFAIDPDSPYQLVLYPQDRKTIYYANLKERTTAGKIPFYKMGNGLAGMPHQFLFFRNSKCAVASAVGNPYSFSRQMEYSLIDVHYADKPMLASLIQMMYQNRFKNEKKI